MNDQEEKSTAQPAGFDIGSISIAGETAAPAPEKPIDRDEPPPAAEKSGFAPPLPGPAETEEQEAEPIAPAVTPGLGRERRRVHPGRRLLLPGVAAAALLLCYLLLSQLLVSLVVPRLLADHLSRKLERPVTIARADWQPLRLVLTLHNGIVGPRLADPQDRIDPLLSFRVLKVDFRLAAVLRGGRLLDELTFEQPFLHLLRDEEGVYNFAAPAFEAIAAGLRPELLNIRNGRLAYTDRGHSPPSAAEAPGGFNLELQEINGRLWRRPVEEGRETVNLELRAAGPQTAAIGLKGWLAGSEASPAYDLHLTVEQLPLAALAVYLHPLLGYEIDGGQLALQAGFSPGPGSQLRIDQQLRLQDLQLGRRLDDDQYKGDLQLLQALLSDREQIISLHLPLTIQTRRRDAPYLQELAAALEQRLAQAESEPLALLANDYPGLASRIDFATGSTELSREAGRDLDRLAAALGERPRLKLEIRSLAEPGCDREALLARQEEQLEEQRRRAVATLARELTAGEIRITPAEISRLRAARAVVGNRELLDLAAGRQQTVRQRLAVAMGLEEEAVQGRLIAGPPAIGEAASGDRSDCGTVLLEFRP